MFLRREFFFVVFSVSFLLNWFLCGGISNTFFVGYFFLVFERIFVVFFIVVGFDLIGGTFFCVGDLREEGRVVGFFFRELIIFIIDRVFFL